MTPAVKSPLEAIFRRTYEHHGGTGAWGYDALTKHCSYVAGCAIGISLPRDVAERGDIGHIGAGNLAALPEGRAALFGEAETPPAPSLWALDSLQDAHDTHARRARVGRDTPELRASYRREVERLADEYGLSLQAPVGPS